MEEYFFWSHWPQLTDPLFSISNQNETTKNCFFSVLVGSGQSGSDTEAEKEGIGLFDTGHFVDFEALDSDSGKSYATGFGTGLGTGLRMSLNNRFWNMFIEQVSDRFFKWAIPATFLFIFVFFYTTQINLN